MSWRIEWACLTNRLRRWSAGSIVEELLEARARPRRSETLCVRSSTLCELLVAVDGVNDGGGERRTVSAGGAVCGASEGCIRADARGRMAVERCPRFPRQRLALSARPGGARSCSGARPRSTSRSGAGRPRTSGEAPAATWAGSSVRPIRSKQAGASEVDDAVVDQLVARRSGTPMVSSRAPGPVWRITTAGRVTYCWVYVVKELVEATASSPGRPRLVPSHHAWR